MASVNAHAVLVGGTVRDFNSLFVEGVDVDFIDVATGEQIDDGLGDTTGLDGTFEVDIPTGTYDVTYAPPPGSSLGGAVQFNIQITGDTTLPQATLPAGYRIQLRTVDGTGQPLDQVRLAIKDGSQAEVFLPRDTTGGGGSIDTSIPQGNAPYRIELRDLAGRGIATKLLIGFEPVADTNLGDIIMGPAQPLSGRAVRFDNSAPVASVDLDVFDQQSGLELEISGDLTGADGLFNVTGLSTGRYVIIFRPPSATGLDRREFQKVRINAPFDMGDVVLGPLRQVSGRVVDGLGNPVDPVDLDLIDQAYGIEAVLNNDNSGSDGTFATETTDGVYTLVFTPLPGSGLAPLTVFDVAINADINLGDFVLGDALTLSGIVTDFNGQPVELADLDVLEPIGGREVETPNDKTNAAGEYAATLAAGTWNLKFSPPAGRTDLQSVTITGFNLTASDTLDIQLPQTTATDAYWNLFD